MNKTNTTLQMHPTEHERAEWKRMAQSAYARGIEEVGNRYMSAATLQVMPLARFDVLMGNYRAWLIDGIF